MFFCVDFVSGSVCRILNVCCYFFAMLNLFCVPLKNMCAILTMFSIFNFHTTCWARQRPNDEVGSLRERTAERLHGWRQGTSVARH